MGKKITMRGSVVSALVEGRLCPEGSGKITLTFQRYIILGAKTQ